MTAALIIFVAACLLQVFGGDIANWLIDWNFRRCNQDIYFNREYARPCRKCPHAMGSHDKNGCTVGHYEYVQGGGLFCDCVVRA